MADDEGSGSNGQGYQARNEERLRALEARSDGHDARYGKILRLDALRRAEHRTIMRTLNYHETMLVALAKGLGVSVPPPPEPDDGDTEGDAAAERREQERSDARTSVVDAAELTAKVVRKHGRTPTEWAKLVGAGTALVVALSSTFYTIASTVPGCKVSPAPAPPAASASAPAPGASGR